MEGVVEDALKRMGPADVRFETRAPPRKELGDLSVNAPFPLARILKTHPGEAAKQLAAHVDVTSANLIGSFESHPDGFINFHVNTGDLIYETLSNATSNPTFGSLNVGKGKKVLVEHTSVNPNKALHVGHLRNLVIGDSVARALRFTGHEVRVLNYIDNSGLQVADLLVGFLRLKMSPEPPPGVKFDHYCGDTVYVRVNKEYEKRAELLDDRRRILVEMEDPSTETAQLARAITLKVLKEQLATSWRMGAQYDLLNFESHILETRLWDKVFEQLRATGIAILASSGKHQGCWIVRVEGEEEGEEKVLVRSNGTATYVAKDIPYASWKIGLVPDPFGYEIFTHDPSGTPVWATATGKGTDGHPDYGGADLAITVIDLRQSRLQRIITHVLGALGGPGSQGRYRHLAYAVVNLSAKTAEKVGLLMQQRGTVKMSGRLGLYVNADDVLDALYERSLEETRRRNPAADDNWTRTVADKLGVGAIRFELLKQDMEKELTFDLEESLRLEGETGPYLQYSYARASRILDKAPVVLTLTRPTANLLTAEPEIDLAKQISKFDLIVEEATSTFSPKGLARYAYTLCTLFNIFYEFSPVLTAAGDLMGARLALVKAFQQTLRNALGLLGIEALEKI